MRSQALAPSAPGPSAGGVATCDSARKSLVNREARAPTPTRSAQPEARAAGRLAQPWQTAVKNQPRLKFICNPPQRGVIRG